MCNLGFCVLFMLVFHDCCYCYYSKIWETMTWRVKYVRVADVSF